MANESVPKVIDVEPGVVGSWFPDHLQQNFAVETTLPQVTDADRARILDIIECESIRGQDILGSVIMLSEYVMHPITLENPESGEVVDAVRTLLVQPEGPPIQFVSTGILKSIARIAWKERRNPPFDPPVKVKLVQKSTGKGRRTYKLLPVD